MAGWLIILGVLRFSFSNRAFSQSRNRASALCSSATDLTSMVIMQERHIVQVFTADAHFTQVGLGFSLVP